MPLWWYFSCGLYNVFYFTYHTGVTCIRQVALFYVLFVCAWFNISFVFMFRNRVFTVLLCGFQACWGLQWDCKPLYWVHICPLLQQEVLGICLRLLSTKDVIWNWNMTTHCGPFVLFCFIFYVFSFLGSVIVRWLHLYSYISRFWCLFVTETTSPRWYKYTATGDKFNESGMRSNNGIQWVEHMLVS